MNDFYSAHKAVDDIDFGKIFRFLLMQSKLIIGITVFGFIISLAIYIGTTKQYSIKSLLQYESVNQNILDPSMSLQMNSRNSSTDIMNLVTLYESRTNILKLIKDLKLNIDIEDLTDGESIDINIQSDGKDKFKGNNLIFSFSKNGYSLLDSQYKEIKNSNYGEYIYFNDLKILILSADIFENRPIVINFRQPESMYNQLKSKISINTSVSKNSFFRNEGLITVAYITDDPEEGKKIVDYANEIFLTQRISVETEKSRKAIAFIDNNIKSLEEIVKAKKIKLKEFRERNQSIDVTLEIQSIIKKIELIEQSIGSLDLAIARAQEVYTENNPVYLNLLNEKKVIEQQKEDVLSEIGLMPKEQQEYIDLYNDVEVSQALFEELEARRLGLSILEASTIGDIRVVDKAYYHSQVSPKIMTVTLFTVISLILGCVTAIFRGFVLLPISNPAELFDHNIHIPIIGVVPNIDQIDDGKEEIIDSAIESLIVNLDSMNDNQNKKNMITITSPGAGNGKSTNSMMLAEGYVKLGKKVLLIDGDLKRGKLGSFFNKKNIDEQKFKSINESNIDDFFIKENFYLLPRVSKLNNSFEFLYKSQYKEKIDFFKEYFDYVILDTAPILSIADTSIMVEQSDFNILVVRHGVNRMNEIKQVIDHFTQINKNISGILYNAYAKPKSYYGYYGLYGNYAYQYYAEKYLDDTYGYKK